MSSRVLKCFPNSSVIEEDGEGLLKAGSIAGTAVLEVTSTEPFGVNQNNYNWGSGEFRDLLKKIKGIPWP